VQALAHEFQGRPDALAASTTSPSNPSPLNDDRARRDAISQIRYALRDELIEKHTGSGNTGYQQLDTLLQGLNALVGLRIQTPNAEPYKQWAIDEAIEDMQKKVKDSLLTIAPNNPNSIEQRMAALTNDLSYPWLTEKHARFYEPPFSDARDSARERLAKDTAD
jgi:hypothetical protein